MIRFPLDRDYPSVSERLENFRLTGILLLSVNCVRQETFRLIGILLLSDNSDRQENFRLTVTVNHILT